jgi:hypothetical protein
MTKEEYTEFLSLQEHYEFLRADYDRKIEKLHSFKIDSKEFDEFLEEAVRFYFNTKINEAWKKIEEFKTATAKTGNVRTLIFKDSHGKDVRIMRDILENADACCRAFDCDDPRNPCPFKDGGGHAWFKYRFAHGCMDIHEMFHNGTFKKEF